MLPQRDSILSLLADEDSDTAALVQSQLIARGPDTLADLRSRGVERLEANVDAQERWVDHVLAVGDSTLFPKSDSWYTGSNIPGKKRIFMPYVGGVGSYRQECDDVRAAGYKGFLTG